MGFRDGQNNCEGDAFHACCCHNLENTCVGSTLRGHNVALAMSNIILVKRCKFFGRLSSHVHGCMDVSAGHAEVLLLTNLLYFVYFAVS